MLRDLAATVSHATFTRAPLARFPYNQFSAWSHKCCSYEEIGLSWNDVVSWSDDALKSSHAIVAHLFREDGIFEVNPDAGHPAFELMDRAEARWQAKLDSASSTLEEAVTEYTQRYKRDSPTGFDMYYVQLHNIQLPDEYDLIWTDLESFWAQLISSDFSLRSVSDPNHLENKNVLRGARDILQDVQHHLPLFRAVFSPHNNPTLLSGAATFCSIGRNARVQKKLEIKYVINVDGNAWSSQASGDIKLADIQSHGIPGMEFLDRIEPLVHYVPIQVDFLHDLLTFFRGGLQGEGAHDDIVRKIAVAGRLWSKTFWRKEDITAYLFR